MSGRKSLRKRRKQETRELIHRAARRLMIEYGYDKVTMRALAAAAGVGLGTIALHFKDKKSLLLETFHDEIGRESIKALSSVPEEGTLKEKFMAILAGLYGYYSQHALFLRPVVREALFATGEAKARFDAQLEEMVGLVAGMIERHKEVGEVRPEVSAKAVAMAGWSLYLNGLLEGLTSEKFDVQALLDRMEPLVDVLLTGVLARREDYA